MILGYVRCSTNEQTKGSTLGEQERKCRGFAIMHSADSFDFGCYVDDGVSGSIPLTQRPQGARMLADAKSGDTLVASKLDRMFRSCSDALVTVEVLAKRGIKVVLLDIAAEAVTDNGVGKFFFSIMAAAAEFERVRIYERTEEGRKAKKARNGCIGNVPFGSMKVGEGKASLLVANPEEEKVISYVHEQLHKGRKPRYILRDLNRMGITSRAGKPLQPVQLQRIINRAYRRQFGKEQAMPQMENSDAAQA